jgi:SHS2 domain-containing protein
MEMEIEAPTTRAVGADARPAPPPLLGDDVGGDRLWREVAVSASQRDELLLAWLDELVYLAETEDLVPQELERVELSGHGLRAAVRCRRGRPRHLVKGATYHRLRFERRDRGFRATVVLDV